MQTRNLLHCTIKPIIATQFPNTLQRDLASTIRLGLDGEGIPPSPVFTPPEAGTPTKGKRFGYEAGGEEPVRQRNSTLFLDGLSKLVGSGGLEDSMHNPNRRASVKEKEPLLRNAGEVDGY